MVLRSLGRREVSKRAVQIVEDIRGKPGCYLVIGGGSWDVNTPVIAFKWLDNRGHYSRPAGEMDADSFLQAIELGVREGFVSTKQVLKAVVAAQP